MAAAETSAHGIHWTFAPMVDISRDARWGRSMEGAGEDPWYGSQVAKARVEGFRVPIIMIETLCLLVRSILLLMERR